ncbi:hypothetical protein E1A91_D11G228700v1 [Gossypium mustelinum]|uniref:Uncharacterized protein n=1 Tax=Gossypium mustelinum TaxID=34275 RepID=A0A5D2SW24_GOSMU|nr:hypothetical protein E1A91_D11G228700v1 [Gossypium mustelinum]
MDLNYSYTMFASMELLCNYVQILRWPPFNCLVQIIPQITQSSFPLHSLKTLNGYCPCNGYSANTRNNLKFFSFPILYLVKTWDVILSLFSSKLHFSSFYQIEGKENSER